MPTLPKTYDPQSTEKSLYDAWEKSGYFNPDTCIADGITDADAPTFSIVLPPPNVTGVLHTGHAAMLSIEDALVRYHRMKGDRTLWIPGTDHAAIATQSKVEKLLKKETEQSRYDLGREAFLQKVETFAQDSHDTIVGQCRAMGASLDWSREAFTLDPARRRAVYTAFEKMYNDGLIYRGDRIVNWDPKGQTTVSDDEVVHKERAATLYTFRYSKDFPIAIATTRPETKVGDTAVAVHPDDARYSTYVGKTFTIDDFCGATLTIHIIADREVDSGFGTGAVGVTPAHSMTDWEMSERHDLERITIIDENARMNGRAGTLLAGKTTEDARAHVVTWLRDNDLLESEEEITQSVATAERTSGIIEPLPKKQWFIAVNKPFERNSTTTTLKDLMRDAVASGAIDILPPRFAKVYFHWIDNLRDWCISRQIWYGHRIPVWYHDNQCIPNNHGDRDFDKCIPLIVAQDQPQCAYCNATYKQDPDTLDTWFSSGIWTFSTLGWPDDTKDFRTYHPTALLETGYDILFFWVARMILMTTYLLDTVPFRTVYLHGLVRDEQGRKMSKSLGNALDPVDVSARYGTDAVRLALLIGAAPGQDMRLGDEKIAHFRNFTNKLWNIGRYVLTTTTDSATNATPPLHTAADHWIAQRLNETITAISAHLDAMRLSQAGEALRDFTWNDFADWYVEVHKVEGNAALLRFVFRTLLHLWHPFMPFVTEELFRSGKVPADAPFLMVSRWPQPTLSPSDAESFTTTKDVITQIRNIRALYRLRPDQKPQLICDSALFALLSPQSDLVVRLARITAITQHTGTAAPRSSVPVTTADGTLYVILDGIIDIAAEQQRLTQELGEIKRNITGKEQRLANENFTARAPQDIVAKERDLLAQLQKRAEEITTALTRLTS